MVLEFRAIYHNLFVEETTKVYPQKKTTQYVVIIKILVKTVDGVQKSRMPYMKIKIIKCVSDFVTISFRTTLCTSVISLWQNYEKNLFVSAQLYVYIQYYFDSLYSKNDVEWSTAVHKSKELLILKCVWYQEMSSVWLLCAIPENHIIIKITY